MLVRRGVLDQVGGFDESRLNGDFTDWYARALEWGLKSRVPEVVVARRRITARISESSTRTASGPRRSRSSKPRWTAAGAPREMLRRRRLPREQLLALRAALLPGPLAHEVFAEWRELVDFDATDAPMYRLLPLIYRNLEAQLESDPVLGRMRGIYRRTRVLNAIQIEGGGRAIVALGERDIPTMLLKGAAMIARWTGDSGVRMMADFDLPRPQGTCARCRFMPPGEGMATCRGSLRAGHGRRPGRGARLAPEERAGRSSSIFTGARSCMVGRTCRATHLSWARAQEVRLDGLRTWVPAPDDHVHQACSHATTWTAAGPSGLDCRLRPHHQRDRLGVRLVPSVRPCPTGIARGRR